MSLSISNCKITTQHFTLKSQRISDFLLQNQDGEKNVIKEVDSLGFFVGVGVTLPAPEGSQLTTANKMAELYLARYNAES